jgi:hypothetical protein
MRAGGREGARARGRKFVTAGMLALSLMACSKKDAETPPADFSTPGAPAQAAPAKFSLADFASLRYLEGKWVGTMINGNRFYESYHFVNDSTILKASHTDSTFQKKSDSSMIAFRNGIVIDSGSSVSTAEKLDLTVVDFRANPNYHFTWTRQSNDAWTAKLFSKAANGTERYTTYPMRRFK